MKERPIFFSSPMVRAILDGRKTQTRRVVKPVGSDEGFVILDYGNGGWPYRSDDGDSTTHTVKRGGKIYLEETPHSCPYGRPGDRLWVRENWHQRGKYVFALPDSDKSSWLGTREITYSANTKRPGHDWRSRPSIHMPRWASRILLEVTAVRVERLADISKDDAMAEGIVLQPDGGFGLADSTHYNFSDPTDSYCSLWESINGSGSWLANPWVWVIEFKKLEGGAA